MSSDVKTRGFGIEDIQIRLADRLDRLVPPKPPLLRLATAEGR